MVQVEIVTYDSGKLSEVTVSGHAGYGKPGTDIVCASVTLLVRTVLKVLGQYNNVLKEYRADKPGYIYFKLNPFGEDDLIKGITEVLFTGLNDLVEEFPGNISLEMKTK